MITTTKALTYHTSNTLYTPYSSTMMKALAYQADPSSAPCCGLPHRVSPAKAKKVKRASSRGHRLRREPPGKPGPRAQREQRQRIHQRGREEGEQCHSVLHRSILPRELRGALVHRSDTQRELCHGLLHCILARLAHIRCRESGKAKW